MFLALAMCLALAAPAWAASPADEPEYDEIVVFSDAASEDGIQPLNDLTDEERIQQAKNGVLALGLEEMGLGYIGEACLSELDSYAESGNIILREYTVLIPKARAATPSYYGTYKDVDIYASIVSRSWYIRDYGSDSQAQLRKWMDSTVNLVSLIGSSVLTISWSMLSALSDNPFPVGYEVLYGDIMTKHVSYNPSNRAFYVKDGNSYRNVCNREFGNARCVTHYTSVDANVGGRTTNYPLQTVPEVDVSNRKKFIIIS